MAQSAYHVTQRVSASVHTTLMEKPATSVRKDSTTSLLVRSAIAIRQVLLPNLLDVDRFLLVSCVSVKNVFKAGFVINVDLFTGISTQVTHMVARTANASLMAQLEHWILAILNLGSVPVNPP